MFKQGYRFYHLTRNWSVFDNNYKLLKPLLPLLSIKNIMPSFLLETDGSSEVQRSVLLSEGVMLAGLNHDQLLGVLGAVVTPPEAPPCIIFPRSSQGNLKR